MNGSPPEALGTLHRPEPSSAWISGESAALAPLAFSSPPSHAGPMTIAGPERNPAAMKSRRVTGSGWFWCRSGSPSACDRGGFLRISISISRSLRSLQGHHGAAEHRGAGRRGCGGDGDAGLERGNAREQRTDLTLHSAGGGRRYVRAHRVADQRIDDDVAVGARGEKRRRAAVDAAIQPGAEERIAQRLGADELSAIGVRQLR